MCFVCVCVAVFVIYLVKSERAYEYGAHLYLNFGSCTEQCSN